MDISVAGPSAHGMAGPSLKLTAQQYHQPPRAEFDGSAGSTSSHYVMQVVALVGPVVASAAVCSHGRATLRR